MSKKPLVIITSRSFSSGSLDLIQELSDAGFDPVFVSPSHSMDELTKYLPHAVGWIAGTARIEDEHLELAPKLRVIARYGVGFDSVDITSAKKHGIVVTNTPGANSQAVAEHTIALTFAALRNITSGDRQIRNGNWKVIRGRQLSGATIGVVGFGRIGRLVCEKYKALGAKVMVHDPLINNNEISESGYAPSTLEKICKEAAIVSLNSPGGSCIIDLDWIAAAKSQQIIINTARAELVDENALAQGLEMGSITAYAADTLQSEGIDSNSPLLREGLMGKVTITGHLGAQTGEAVDAMGKMSVENLIAVLNHQPALNSVL